MATRDTEMDPRIAARRDSVAEDRRRPRRRLLLVVAIVVTVLAGAFYITRTPLFDVDSIEVVGNDIVTAAEILDASGISIGEPLLEVDPSSSAASIERIPWIDTAEVDRSWGGAVVITVTERVEVAVALDAAGQPMMLDVTGRVLAPDGPFDRAELLLEGIEAGDPGTTVDGAAEALAAVALMGPGVRSRIASVAIDGEGAITLRLRPQGTVILGPPTDLAAKIASLAIVLGQVDQRDLATIDLTDPSTPIVVRTPK